MTCPGPSQRNLAVCCCLALMLALFSDLTRGQSSHRLAESRGDGGPAIRAKLTYPTGVALDSQGNLYIADTGAHRIRKVDRRGKISTVVGTGLRGYSGDGGQAVHAQIAGPNGLVSDRLGNLYFTDSFNDRIRKVDATGRITTVAGNGTDGYSGDGGDARKAQLSNPQGVALDQHGNLLVADTFNSVIRRVDRNGIITTLAGSLPPGLGGDGGPAAKALLSLPYDVAAGPEDSIVFCDTANSRIRRVDGSGTMHPVTGLGPSAGVFGAGFKGDDGPAATAQIHSPAGLALDRQGRLYFSDTGNNRVRLIENGTVRTIAGTGRAGFHGDGWKAIEAEIHTPQKLAVDEAGNIYLADRPNHRVRRIDWKGTITTVAGSGEISGVSYEAGAP